MIYKTLNFVSLASTQDKAKQLAKKGSFNKVIIAEKQTKGRGRFNRKWFSSQGGLWMSIILKPSNIRNSQYLTFAAAVAVVNSIKKTANLNAKIKWPNDVHYNGKKLCGILTESILGKENYVIVGIGLNINQKKFPEEIEDKATSLKLITKKNFDIKKMSELVANKFFILYDKFYNKNRLDKILDLWKKHCDTLSKEAEVTTKKGKFIGKAVGIDDNLNLILKLRNNKRIRIIEGDVIY